MPTKQDVGFKAVFDEKEFVQSLKKMQTSLGTINQEFDKFQKKYTKTTDAQSKTLNKMNAGFTRFAQLATGAFSLTAVISYGNQLRNTALSLELLANKAKTVFGPELDRINKKAEIHAQRMGLTETEYVNNAAKIQDLLIPMGFLRSEATDISADLTNLSGALSEWSGGQFTATQVTDTLTKAMLGEREMLKSLGISITEEEIQANLTAKGLENLTGQTLQQARAAATLELITRKSTDAQTSFAEGANSLGATTAQLNATLRQSKEDLANSLIPVFKRLTLVAIRGAEGLQRMVEIATKHGDVIKALIRIIAAFTIGLQINTAWKERAAIRTAALEAKQRALNVVMKANPIGLVITAVTALVSIFTLLYKRSEKVRSVMDGLWSASKRFVSLVKESVMPYIEAFKTFSTDGFGAGMAAMGKALLDYNPIGFAVSAGKEMGKAYTDGVNESLNKSSDDKWLKVYEAKFKDLEKQANEIDLTGTTKQIERQKDALINKIQAQTKVLAGQLKTEKGVADLNERMGQIISKIQGLKKTAIYPDPPSKDAIDALAKFNDLMDDLANKVQQAGLQGKEGVELIQAQTEIELAKVEGLKKVIEEAKQKAGLGALDEEELAKFTALSDAILAEQNKKIKEFNDARDKQRKDWIAQTDAGVKAMLQEQIKTIDEEAALEQLRINNLQESGDELLTLEEYKQLKLLELQKKALESKLRILEQDKSISLTQLESIKEQIKGIDQEIAKLGKDDSLFGSIGDIIKTNLVNAFGLDDFQAQMIMQQAEALFNGLGSLMMQNNDIAIAENQRLLESIRERIDETESLLEDEESRREKGYANNVESKKRELEQLKAEEEKALKEQEKLQKERIKAQLIADATQQISGLALMAVNVLSSSAKFGPIAGPILAAAAITTMIGLFKSIKAQSAQLAEVKERAFKGGPIDQFLAGRSDKQGGRGHRIEDSNVVVGGGEYLLNDTTTRKQRPFIEDLNRGLYDNVDLQGIIKPMVMSGKYASQLKKRDMFSNKLISREEFAQVMEVHANRIEEVLEKAPLIYTIDDTTRQIVTISGGKKKILNL